MHNNIIKLIKRNDKNLELLNKIVELKYNIEDDKCAQQISTQFPFRINKNSKYVNGVNTIKQFPQ